MIKTNNLCIISVRFLSTNSKPPKHLQLTYKAPPPKLNTGLRGNHNHGRKLYDQVYPTTKVPSCFVPRYPLDWRNAGRFILTAGLARLDHKRLYRHPHSLNYQSSSHCGDRCANICSNSQYKCLCSMRSYDIYNHISNVDSILMSYKAPVVTKKQIFTTLNYLPMKNTQQSNKFIKVNISNSYQVLKRTYKYPVFEDRNNVTTSVYSDILPNRDSYSIFDVKSDQWA